MQWHGGQLPRLFVPLATRDFRLLWLGRTVSLVGDGMFTVAIVWQTTEVSSGPVALSVVMLGRVIPRVATLLLGGAAGDRIGRRSILLSTELIQGVAVAILALLAALDAVELWSIVVLEVIAGAAQGFFLPNSTAMIPELLERDQLVQGNALDASSRLFAQQFAGPALGGVLIATAGTAWAFAIDAATFVAGAVAVAAIRSLPKPERSETSMLQDVKEGFAYTRRTTWLWVTLIAAAFWNLIGSGVWSVLVPLRLKEGLGASASQFGMVFAAFGIGGGLAALASGQFRTPTRRLRAALLIWGSAAFAVVGIGVAPTAVAVAGAMAYAGFALEYGNVIWSALMQDRVPQRILGRVSSVDWFLSLGLQPVGLALVGPLAGAIGIATTLVGGGITMLAVTVVAFAVPGVLSSDLERATPEKTPAHPYP